ncbi:MAG: DUF2303 family protein [Cutibacterium sp.]|nr:DUF2303 family protein [Renibacterium sp.]MBR2580288.1 DUF2303 family protein [Cutibacterium sp.]
MADNYNTAARPDAEVIAELGKQAATADALLPGMVYALLDEDGGIRIADTDAYAPRPRRKSGLTRVSTAESFIEYLDKHGISGETEVTGLPEAAHFKATIDAGTDRLPGWEDQKVVLQLREAPEWERWNYQSGTFTGQEEFAEFIENNAVNIVEPSSAEILEIASSLQVRRGVEFESATRLATGDVQFGYRETSTASAGTAGQLSIPERFTLALRRFDGGETYKVDALFRWRLRGKDLSLGYKLQNAEKITTDAFDSIAEGIAEHSRSSGYLYLTN